MLSSWTVSYKETVTQSLARSYSTVVLLSLCSNLVCACVYRLMWVLTWWTAGESFVLHWWYRWWWWSLQYKNQWTTSVVGGTTLHSRHPDVNESPRLACACIKQPRWCRWSGVSRHCSRRHYCIPVSRQVCCPSPFFCIRHISTTLWCVFLLLAHLHIV